MSDLQRAVLKGLLGGAVQTRTMFTADVNVVSPDTRATVWEEYISSIITPIRPYIANVMVWNSFDIYLRVGTQWEFLETVAYNNNGSATGESLANLVSATMIGNAGGIRQIGRKFWSGLAETAVNGNALVSAGLAAFASGVAAYVTLLTTSNGSTLSPGIVNKSNVFRPFLSGLVSQLLGTMRRRKPGLGI